MKQVLLLTLCLILFGCGSRKAVTTTKQESNTQLSSKTDDVKQTTSTINTETKTDQTGTTETTTTKTDFTPVVDPKTGDIVPVKTHEETTTTKQSSKEQKQESKQESKANTQAKTTASQSTDNHRNASQKTTVKTAAFDWPFGIIAAAMAALWLWIKYRPPAILKKIIAKLK